MDVFTLPPHLKKAISLVISLSFLFSISFFITSNFSDQSNNTISLQNLHETTNSSSNNNCTGVLKLPNYASKCHYVRSHTSCHSEGYINYLEIFYCKCNNSPILGYSILLSWLVVLFYVLGNTTSEYFVPSVENLSIVLNLSPTIAGTTLLPFGNGANDVFSSIISFTRSGNGDVGLNSVLGGALFISCFVVGVVTISISSRKVRVDCGSFVRDVVFFICTLCCLLMIVIFGEVNLWFAVCFVSIYFVYIAVVSAMHLLGSKEERVACLPDFFDEFGAMGVPLLGYVDEEKGRLSDFRVHHHKKSRMGFLDSHWWNWTMYILELPVYLPRRLTIPVTGDEKWSKPFAIASTTFAPILLATLWNTQGVESNAATRLAIYVSSISIGLILGSLALCFTRTHTPPKRFLLPWLAGGFLMSITWTYIIVEELVSLLVAFGNILGINPSILGLTVLAWGNSIGDLISNLGMALKDGPDGAQVAMSGCYAGPLFNTLMGLGVSLVFASWKDYPSAYAIPRDTDLYETVGFLIGGLLWALVILPKRNMVLDKSFGVGLLAIYICFLFLRLVKGVGLLQT